MTRNTTAQICRVTTAYIAPNENIIYAPPNEELNQCELAVAAKLIVACGFHGEPRSHSLLSLVRRTAAMETLRA
jgi:hypothetical protein